MKKLKAKKQTRFEDDLLEKLRDPEFASAYIMSALVDHDIHFLPVALGDVARAHGVSKLAEQTGLHRRTLYKVFDKSGRPSFDLVAQIASGLGLEIHVRPRQRKVRAS